jgi:hypothetical protein
MTEIKDKNWPFSWKKKNEILRRCYRPQVHEGGLMIRRIALRFAAVAIFLPAMAAAQVPKYFNFQSVLRDDSGNLIEDGFMDLTFKILDQDGDELYAEVQPGVQVVRSAINVMLGEGVVPGSSPSAPTGGLPSAALDPNQGAHFLQVQFGSNLPSDPMELGSVPYAMYAEMALGLAPNILSGDVPDVFVTEDELAAAIQAHENDTTAHPASSITVAGPFTSIAGSNVEQVFQSIDSDISNINSAISNINNIPGILNDAKVASTIARDSEVSSAVNAEASARSSADSALQTQINDHETRITTLEGKPEIAAWAFVTDSDGSLGSKSSTGHNIASVVREDHLILGKVYLITFSNSIGTNYSATATANVDVNGAQRLFANVPSRGSSSVRVRIKEESGGQDYGSFSLTIVR